MSVNSDCAQESQTTYTYAPVTDSLGYRSLNEHERMNPFAARLVLPVAGVVLLVQLVLADRYGYHRDELYFRIAGRHPAFGYDDQGPLTPLSDV